jgi:uncharacterized protein
MKNERIDIIDILRGFALIGILFANIPGIARMSMDTAADKEIYHFIGLVFEQRFFPIFSFLFGLGFFIFMRNAEEKGLSPYKLIARRLGLLITFGILHQFLQPGEALLIYGLFGLGLLPLYKRSPKIILIAAGIALILGVMFSELFTIVATFYFGLFVGKVGYFENPAKYRRPLLFIWVFSLLAIYPAIMAQGYFHVTIHSFVFQDVAGLFIATAMVSSLLLWRGTERWLHPLAAFGRTALTNYIMQSVIVLFIALAFGGKGTLSYQATPWIWIAVFPAQIIVSNWWMRRFNYGPLEWLWRWGTYGRKPQFAKPL